MSKVIDMTNQICGQLTVLSRAENDKHGKAQWLCQCNCGSSPKVISGAALRRGLVVSCGCHRTNKMKQYNESKVINETGNTYGYLTVINRNVDPIYNKDGRAMWNCQCRCGNTCVVSGKALREGHTTSCGCRTQSIGEETVEKLLLLNNILYAKEYTVQVRTEKIYQSHKARFDFAIFDTNNNLEYFIEYDGSQHFEHNIRENGLGWNRREAFEKTKERDLLKNQWCEKHNIPLIRIPYWILPILTIEDLQLNTSKYIVNGE